MPIAQKQATTAWPDGSTWVFQGTIAEDATAGTHVCSLTVSPGVGNEMQVLYGGIISGNTATSQTQKVFIDDGTNIVGKFLFIADTVANTERWFPLNVAQAANTNQFQGAFTGSSTIVSGTMRLILSVSTAAVSVTQTFAVVCRLRSPKLPTATLLDTIGTSTNTVNTNKIFG